MVVTARTLEGSTTVSVRMERSMTPPSTAGCKEDRCVISLNAYCTVDPYMQRTKGGGTLIGIVGSSKCL